MTPASSGIGEKIRALRKEKGMTLAQLASLCKYSSSLLSQVETGIANPSLSTLGAIANALSVHAGQLVTADTEPFTTNEELSYIMKSNERKVLTTEGGIQFQLLSRNLNVPFEFNVSEWPPGTSTGKNLYTHVGVECGLFLEGELEVEAGGKRHHMQPGDTITLLSSTPHRISNPGKKELWLFG
jgi:transcriptional regulator with XRE-family HTH domain